MPEFSLGDTEAAELSKAYADVAAFYPSFALDPKHAAVANLGAVLAIVVGSRVTNYKLRRSMTPQRMAPVPLGAETYTPGTPPAQTAQQTGGFAPPGAAPQINGVDMTPKTPPKLPDEFRQVELPGIGIVEFPKDHPLVSGKLQ